jgi:hypothetical protein
MTRHREFEVAELSLSSYVTVAGNESVGRGYLVCLHRLRRTRSRNPEHRQTS